ncbi:AEX-3 domain-domain-containing protein [Lobosporangium transversale]|uniref:AEX-3 domain-domain-containing protein n=1 Tax=Lobosporangium transversale TaxID=64571 RepID=A0A1Y2GMJ2_9FUNG|nr:AEX-3 domain-domain-containing protein [Lobosporangium transversale]ORZ16011.1 AEX-3 domain-domain-containing protein [Lobosporangium transversale]|eukprot:XP_021881358.1 AEX-3 domain-domain-containing protein [Lobosporangium transversale]
MTSMTGQSLPPKRIADYFFMVGLRDDILLAASDIPPTEPLTSDVSPTSETQYPPQSQSQGQGQDVFVHSSFFNGDTASALAFIANNPQTHTQATETCKTRSNQRARSKSMAQVTRPHPTSATLDNQSSTPPSRTLAPPYSVIDSALTERSAVTAAPKTAINAALAISRRPNRRSVTLSDINIVENNTTRLRHKPSYRHISAGTLFRTVQEGIRQEIAKDPMMVRDDDDDHEMYTAEQHTNHSPIAAVAETRIISNMRRQSTSPLNMNAMTTQIPALSKIQQQGKTRFSVQDKKCLTFEKNMAVVRSRSKIVHGADNAQAGGTQELTQESARKSPDIHPAELLFDPIVTCRYPETDWEDAEAFPPHLPMFCFPGGLSFVLQEERPPTTYHSFVMTQETGNRSYAVCVTIYERLPTSMQQQFIALCEHWTRNHMSESEMEYVKAIKTKISRERATLHSLRNRLKEEQTLGRKPQILDLKRDIFDSEEKLALLEDQMQPWKRLFVEPEDVWIPRCVGLVSAVPYHYLLRDWLLAVVVACSGGVEHPGLSSNSFRLESYVKNIIHDVGIPPFGKLEIGITINDRMIYASRPALNSVPIVKNFSLYPLFRCISAEDIVTLIEVMLSEGRIIFISSHLGMLTLAAESLLYMFFPLYWHGVYIPILPGALMTCLQAPVPYIIGVKRSCCESDFPPEEACVVDLDRGTVNVQLPPIPLPPRPRRKLIQSFEQYAPSCTNSARRRLVAAVTASTAPTAYSIDSVSGPPKYVQEAYPYSRLTLFCGVSRAPRRGSIVRTDSLRPPAGSAFSNITSASSSVQDVSSCSGISRNSSTNTLTHNGLHPASLPKIPKMEFEKETLMEGLADEMKIVLASSDDQARVTDMPLTAEGTNRDPRNNKVAPEQNTTEVTTAMRKVLTSQRAHANLFEAHKRQDSGSSIQQQAQQQSSSSSNVNINSIQCSYLASVDTPTRALSHKSSMTSIESSRSRHQGSVVHTGSPLSTMTSNTMASINGSTQPGDTYYMHYESSSTTSLPPLVHNMSAYSITTTSNNASSTLLGSSVGGGGAGSIEEAEPEPSIAPILKEGHALSSVPSPAPIALINCCCGICSHVLASHQQIYRCEGCSLLIHAGCIEELLYPCVPCGFDESGICWSVLQMWAGLLKGYRSGILAGQQALQHQMQQFQQQHYMQAQNPRGVSGHTRQRSSSGSEDWGSAVEKETKDLRFTWASLRGWASRSSSTTNTNTPSTPSVKSPAVGFSQTIEDASTQQQPVTRARRGTGGSAMSDVVRFHRDVFMKTVDKDAKPFMTAFTESQAFVQFVQDRVDRSPGDPEIMFFDEVIKTKINRSRFRLGKEETKFLDDTSYGIQSTTKAAPPSGDIDIHNGETRRFPTGLDPAYL